MATGMRLWFQRFVGFLGMDEPADRPVREVLRAAALRSASIGIGTVDGVELPNPFSGHVVDIEDDAIVISRPLEGPARRELLSGERLHLSIAADRGFHHGDVEVIGRWSAGDGAARRFGYRVTIPRVLLHEERRSLHRVPVAFDLAPKASLVRPVSLAPVGEGVVLDISEGGMCVRADLRVQIALGELVVLRAEFPEILPPIHARMELAHSQPAKQQGLHELGLRFSEVQPELGQAIRALELRRIRRAGAA